MEWVKRDGKPLTRENIAQAIERHYKTSETDVDVLAYAISQARHGQHSVVGEKDVDFEYAIDLIKKEHPKIGSKIDYVNNYHQAA